MENLKEENFMEYKAITKPQMNYIAGIMEELCSAGFRINFEGTTRKEASAFIEKYAYYAKDIRRIKQGKAPFWSMIVNQPPRDEILQQYMDAEYDRLFIPPMDQFDYHSWGDGFSEL